MPLPVLVSMFHSVVARDASKPEITDNHSYGLCQFGRWIDHLGPLDNDELPYVRLMDSAINICITVVGN